MSLEIGQPAPDFELRDQHRQPIRLSDYRGKRDVVVVFLPYAFSGICTGELCELRDGLADLAEQDVQVLAITCDAPPSNAAWAEQQGYRFPILSDHWPHGEVSRAYGSFDEQIGCSLRGSFVIDREGNLAWKVVNGVPEARDLQAYREALAALA
jgi:peroxiredoxin